MSQPIKFSDFCGVYLLTIDHLNLKVLIFCWYPVRFKICNYENQDFGNFELQPMYFYFFIFISENEGTRDLEIPGR